MGSVTGQSIFTFEGSGMTLDVYDDRVEVGSKKRVQSIPLSAVDEVLVTSRPKRLVIVTREGKHYEYSLGRDAEGARAAINSQLKSIQS